jgi:ABC-type transport system substrate-binding protein
MRGAVFDTLTEVGPDGLLRPELATEWKSDAQGRDWVLTLRADVSFHDGQTFTAEHAAASLDAHALNVTQMDASGMTLCLSLALPNPQLPYLLADPGMIMVPASATDLPVGTGVYQTTHYQPGRHFIGTRVQPHFKDGHAGWFDSVEIAVIPDPVVRAEAVRDGFVDVAELPTVDGPGDTTPRLVHIGGNRDALAAREGMGVPPHIGRRAPLDDGRIAQRWWML